MLMWILLQQFYERVLFSLWVMLSFSELDFKCSVHVFDVYTKCMLSTLDFLTVSHLKSMIYLYHGSENCENQPCYHKYGYNYAY